MSDFMGSNFLPLQQAPAPGPLSQASQGAHHLPLLPEGVRAASSDVLSQVGKGKARRIALGKWCFPLPWQLLLGVTRNPRG